MRTGKGDIRGLDPQQIIGSNEKRTEYGTFNHNERWMMHLIVYPYEEKPRKIIIKDREGKKNNHTFYRGKSLCFCFSSCLLLPCTNREETQGLLWGPCSTLWPPVCSSITQCTTDHLITQLFRRGPSPHSRHSSEARAHGYKEIFNYTGAPTWGFSPTVMLWDVFNIHLPV